jgi:arginyl-tRNA synthetase
MILPVHSQVRAHIIAILRSRYGLEGQDAPAVLLEYPPSRELGDLSTPVAFELAKRLRKAPKIIAQEIADALSGVEAASGASRRSTAT